MCNLNPVSGYRTQGLAELTDQNTTSRRNPHSLVQILLRQFWLLEILFRNRAAIKFEARNANVIFPTSPCKILSHLDFWEDLLAIWTNPWTNQKSAYHTFSTTLTFCNKVIVTFVPYLSMLWIFHMISHSFTYDGTTYQAHPHQTPQVNTDFNLQ